MLHDVQPSDRKGSTIVASRIALACEHRGRAATGYQSPTETLCAAGGLHTFEDLSL